MTVNWIVVKVDCKCWWNLQSVASLLQSLMKLFTVVEETYMGTHRTAPVSFIADCKSYTTDCKSDMANCKFCQSLQLATVAVNTIWLTITRGRGNWYKTQYTPRGGWKQKFLISYAPRGVLVGKTFHLGILYPARFLSSGAIFFLRTSLFQRPSTVNNLLQIYLNPDFTVSVLSPDLTADLVPILLGPTIWEL